MSMSTEPHHPPSDPEQADHADRRLLTADEVGALRARAAAVVDDGIFPADHSGHRYPWPLV